jgi:outer membrane receptor for ferrienterochelin and colicins
MFKKVFLIMIFVFLCGLLLSDNSGSVTGSVIGSVSNEAGDPVSEVLVKVNNLEYRTDDEGLFRIDNLPYGKYEITISKPGMITRQVTLHLNSSGQDLNVVLKKETKLDEISVTASKTVKFTKDIPVKVDIIPLQEIEDTNSQIMDEALSYVPGIEVEGNGYSRGTVKLQGLPSQYTLVLVDGERTKGGHNGTDVSQIPLDSVERIEVIKGPASALYGSDALGGVVNVITKDAPQTLELGASYSLNSFYTNIYKLNAGYSLDNWGISSNARRYDTEGEIDSEGYVADNLFAKLSYKGLNKYTASGNYYQEERNLYAMEETKYNVKLASEFNNFETMQMKASVYYIEYTREMNSGEPTKAVEDELKASFQMEKYFENEHGLIAGAELVMREYDSHIVIGDDDIQSAYLQYEMPFYDKFTATIGGRIDHHEDWGWQPAPKLSLLYNGTDDFLIRGSIGKGYKAPSLSQLHSFWYHQPGGGLWIQGNEDLEPENSIGLNLNSEFKIKNIHSSVSLFHNRVEDMIVTEYVGTYDEDDHPLYTYFNKEKVNTFGAEYQGRLNFKKYFDTTIGYTYLMTEDEQTEKELTNSANHKILAGLKYSNQEIIKDKLGFTAGFKLNWRSSMFLDYLNSDEADDRLLINFNTSLSLYKKVEIAFGIKNLLDEEYMEWTSMPGRTFTSTFKVKY